MLNQLYIKNFTLIDELNIDFAPGFSVITGETGAGKSIILGAIGLLLGQRADSKTIKAGADKCVIEAHFRLGSYASMAAFFEDNDLEFDADDTIVRRELSASGKSRAFINDTPVPLALLKDLGEQLVDIHSQHQNLLLSKQDFQLEVVDTLSRDERELQAYRIAYADYQQQATELNRLCEELNRNRENQDFLQFQFDELSAARLTEGEQEELEVRSDTMTHSEEIKSALYTAENALQGEQSGIVGQLRTASSALQGIARVMPAASELADRLNSSYIELKDIAEEVSSRLEDVDFDPSELEQVNARLDQLYALEKKYHVEDVGQLIILQHNLEHQLSQITNGDEALEEQQQKVEAALNTCKKQAQKLTVLRKKAAATIEKEMKQRLVPLGMPNVRFEVHVEPVTLGRNGQDRVFFLFSANTSTALQPVAQVASGGEIARVMLALKAMISGTVKLPTIIFDEIDTGVSGKIAEQMANIMVEMGAGERQVISITHLPQIAAKGTAHYKVYKEETKQGTQSHMQQLNDEQRVAEIAQMLSGSNVSEAAVANARQLLGMVAS